MDITSVRHRDDGIVERDITIDGVAGILWTPASASVSAPVPLILLGYPSGPGLSRMRPRLDARARACAELGFASVALELPGNGERPAMPELEAARADLMQALHAGERPTEDVIDRLVLPLVDRAVPELQKALDELLAFDEISGPVAYSGGVLAIGIRLAAIDQRIVAAGFFAGSYVPLSMFDEARRITIPLHVLLQWDDEGNDRQRALDVFDAFGSAEKTLQANLGGHTGVPAHAGEDAGRFFARHLTPRPSPLVATRSGYSSGTPPLYYEWHGHHNGGTPLLLVHGGGSTIDSNWSTLLPELARDRRVLAVELQGHGHTDAGDREASFEGSADGLAALLAEVGVPRIDVLGFSNGGQVALQLAIRHPDVVGRVIAASAPFRRDGMIDGFWEGLEAGSFSDLPAPYMDADLVASGDPAHAERMFHLDRTLMLTGFQDWPDDQLRTIAAPVLVVAGDRDVIRVEHAVRLAELIPGARLLIVPGNHGDYLGELLAADGDPAFAQRTLPFLLGFLDAQ